MSISRASKTNKCLLTILSIAELKHFKQVLIEINNTYQSFECIICTLDDENDDANSILGQTSWKIIPASESIGDSFLDKAFFFSKEQLSAVCRINCLAELVSHFDVVISIQPKAFDVANEFVNIEILDNTIVIPTDKSTPSIDALPETGYFGNEDAALAFFYTGEGVCQYLNWCRKKVDYVLRYYNGNLTPLSIDNSQISILQRFFDYIKNFDLNLDLSVSYPLNEQLSCDIPSEYRYNTFSNGVLISPLLRENYLRNYRLRLRCGNDPFSHADVLLNETDIIGDSFPVPLTPIMSEIFQLRPDLCATFGDIKNPASRYAFTKWFITFRDEDSLLCNLDDPYFSPVIKAYESQVDELNNYSLSRRARLLNKLRTTFSICSRKKKQPLHNAATNKDLPYGVNLCGFINGSFGLGEAVRILAGILEAGDIPFTIVDFQAGGQVFKETSWQHKITNEFKYNTNIILSAPDWLPTFIDGVDPKIFKDRYTIGYWFWELAEIPPGWLKAFDLVDEVWTASEFSKDIFQAYTEKPVKTIPLSVSMPNIAPLSRKDFDIEEDAFLFFMTYDFYSTTARKNPEAAMAAFLQSFPDDKRARLIVKISEMRDMAKLDKIISVAKNAPNIDFIEGILPKAELNALINCCDVVVSLHRAEGFGLVPAEAMCLGKPTVITNWSGNTEYMTDENCCPVDYVLVEIEEDSPPYSKGYHWADADVDHAATYMRRLYEDKDYYNSISVKAKETIQTRFSPDAIAVLVKNRFGELNIIQK